MALSFFTNQGTDDQYLVPDILSNADQLFTFQENFGFSEDMTAADPFFLEPDQYLYSHDSNHHLLFPHRLISLPPEIFPAPQGELESLYAKRQKVVYDDDQRYYLDYPQGYYFFPHVPELIMPDFQAPPPPPMPTPLCGCENNVGKKGEREGLSAQSIAARQRRRKITEKTQELGKLIPGGNKMNTAEMFQAAFMYVKYLQAQVAMLQLISSLQYNEEVVYVEELLHATTSPVIQEKLYSVEKCLVPKKFLETLANDAVLLQSNHLILNGLQDLIQPAN